MSYRKIAALITAGALVGCGGSDSEAIGGGAYTDGSVSDSGTDAKPDGSVADSQTSDSEKSDSSSEDSSNTDGAVADSAQGDSSAPDSSIKDSSATDSTVSDTGILDTGVADVYLPPVSYDLVVVGAGSSGVSAAIQAARLGMHVALLEETDWVGGQMTSAAVPNMDEGGYNKQSGIFAEFIAKVSSYYAAKGKTIGTCYWAASTRCFEPFVGRKILLDMMAAEPNITLMLRTTVGSVRTETVGGHNRVTGVGAVSRQGGSQKPISINTPILIEATEYGDLLTLAPVHYRAGNTTDSNLAASHCVQDITYAPVLRKYANGVPAELKMSSAPPGYSTAVRNKFAAIVTKTGSSDHANLPVNWAYHNAYRGLPNSQDPANYDSTQASKITKTVANWANDFAYTAGNLSRSERMTANCAAKLHSLQFLWYVQNELGETLWSVANDEGYDSAYNIEENACPSIPSQFKSIEKHFPPMPYIREARRLIGNHTLTASEIKRSGSPPLAAKSFVSSMALGDYAVDLHHCNAQADLEASLESTADVPPGFQGGLFQIPFESMLTADLDGFIVAEKNLSLSRLANGASRLQPITMLTGQAAGTIAALAKKRKVAPSEVPSVLAQQVLLDDDSALSLSTFTDVSRASPYWADIQLVSTRGVMNGKTTTSFGVTDSLDRAQAAVVLVRLLGLKTDPAPAVPSFADVPASHYAYKYVEALKAGGITNGCGGTPANYCPDVAIKRIDFTVLLVKAMKLDITAPPSNPYYQDLPSTQFGFAHVQVARSLGLVENCSVGPDRYCPSDPLGRGDVSRIASKSLLYLAK